MPSKLRGRGGAVTPPVPIAFYAPLKSPGHPVPSGDRTVGRLFWRALARAGFAPTLASELRTHEPDGDPVRQDAIRLASAVEGGRIVDRVRAGPSETRPRLWFTYHCYYKAPDWIGPAVATALGIPYVVAEGTRAAKRARGAWALGHGGAEAALDRADAIVVATAQDRESLAAAKPPGQILIDLPPFLDIAEWPFDPAPAPPGEDRPHRLLTVAMMRDGDKLASYRLLAGALHRLDATACPPRWCLSIAGDGPARPDVERLFAPFGERVAMLGRVDGPPRLAALYGAADLLVWPAVNEAFGMALLEAQATGCPVIAGRHGGVESAMRPGVTGLLTTPGDAGALADGIGALLGAPARLAGMRSAARRFVESERDLHAASRILRTALGALLPESGRASA